MGQSDWRQFKRSRSDRRFDCAEILLEFHPRSIMINGFMVQVADLYFPRTLDFLFLVLRH